jgi:trehalose utilization protein
MNRPRVTVWNEYVTEKTQPEAAAIYPQGMHEALADYLRSEGMTVATATLEQLEHGLTEARLAETDVLLWWGLKAHDLVDDQVVDRVYQRVLDGMGLIALHSAHHAKIFRKLMGTTGNLKWRVAAERERIWLVAPAHPICAGLPEYIELEQEEMYGECFDVPVPEELVLLSWFQGGEVFRSGCCYTRGRGKIFYFRPGHQTYPTFHHPQILRLIRNAVEWAVPVHTNEGSIHRPGGGSL